jgi:hypothetical protein
MELVADKTNVMHLGKARETRPVSHNSIEIKPYLPEETAMPRAVERLLWHLPFRPWVRTDRQLRWSNSKKAQMASFLEDSGFRPHCPGRHERSLRRRRLARAALFWLSAFGAAWIVLESARALTLV